MQHRRFWLPIAIIFSITVLVSAITKKDPATGPRRLELLFLGHKNNTGHNSEKLAQKLATEYFKSGINISFTNDPNDMNEENLSHYDGLIVYANHDTISKSQEKALLGFVRGGKGLIALHSASFCFRNSQEVVEMIGGQFQRHKFDTFSTVILKPGHEVMKGIAPFITRDETYVHTKISPNIEVLTERVEGDHHEPYTWVRPFGQGRVFYTAYGHNDTTFNNQGFLDLVKNGLLWAVGDKAKADLAQMKLADPKYFDGLVPNYERKNPAPKVQESLTPEQSMTQIQVPVGFELQLFAAEPMIVNPIYINWDEKGRLWAIETVDYPNEIKTDDIGDDRVIILEDTDGDGKADKRTVFAEKLNIPTSFVFSNGGIIVSQSPSSIYLKDTNGDDKADVRQEFITGWGKNDTHAQSSNLHYGFDNQIWGVVGYSGFYNGKKGKDSIRFSNSAFKFDPNSKKIEFLSTVSNNVWGLGFSEESDVFISTANNTHTAFFGMPYRYFEKGKITNESGVLKLDAHYDMRSVTKNLRQVDVQGGFTAAAGHDLYTARTFPKSYWNRVGFVTEPTGRVVHKVNIKPDGAGFAEDGDGWNIFTSADEWAAPIQATVGPDGSVWITDWYDFIIQHNPTPSVQSAGVAAQNGKGNAYVNPLRDHERGRIYRLVYKANDKKNTLKLDKNDLQGLVKALSNDNMFWRMTAQRLLVEKKDKSVIPQLVKIAQDQSVDEIGINAPVIHALWTLHGLGAFSGVPNATAVAAATKALSHSSAGVRRVAIQVLPKTAVSFQSISKAGAFNDKDYRVRLAAVLATTDMPKSAAIGKALVDMAGKEENFSDMWLRYALQIASKLNENEFRAEFRKRGLNDNPSLMEASLAQRLAYGSRLNTTLLRRTFGRNPQIELNPSVGNNEFAISGEMQFQQRPGGPPPPPGAQPLAPNTYTGMVVAQGDSKEGYGIYFMDNKMMFTVNQAGKAYNVTTTQKLPAKFTFKAGLQRDGTMRLYIDDKEAGNAKTPGLFKNSLDVPMRIGIDAKTGAEKIAAYPDSFLLIRNNNFTNGKLEIVESIAAKAPVGPVAKVITLNVLKNVMKYDKELITAKAGTTIQIVLVNPDFMQHNLLLIKPGTIDKVGAAADALARDPNGAKMSYIPKMPEVIAATAMLNPGGKATLTIKLPDVAGDYPYICTFPGHWRIMKGILRVTK